MTRRASQATQTNTPQPARPHIVYMDCHDLGNWLGCYGRAGLNTPNLDRLAAEGAMCTQMIATAPICIPSRASLYTGQMPHVIGAVGQFPYTEGTVCLAEYLRRGGYATVLAGERLMIRNDPAWAGFEHCLDAADDGQKVEAAVEFLSTRTGIQQPFLLSLSFQSVHRPFGQQFDQHLADMLAVPPYLPDTLLVRRDLSTLHRQIEALDSQVGRVLDALQQNGLAAHTLVVFVTEHGPAIARAKHTLYDSGLRTACILRSPAAIAAGQQLSQLLSNLDLLPTMLSLAGLDPPPGLPGVSFEPLLRGQPHTAREVVFAEHTWGRRAGLYHYMPSRAVRTQQFKFIRNFSRTPHYIDTDWLARFGADRSLPEQVYGHPAPPVELYDLAVDPFEQSNLAGQHEYAEVEARLQGQLTTFLAETNDPILAGPVPHPEGLPDVPLWELQADGAYRLRAFREQESSESAFV